MSDAIYEIALTDVHDADVPASTPRGRKPAPNPLLPIVEAYNSKRDKSATFTIAYDADMGEKRAAAIKRDLTKAGQKLGVVVRRNVVVDESAKVIRVTLWVVDKPAQKDDTPDPVKSVPTGKATPQK